MVIQIEQVWIAWGRSYCCTKHQRRTILDIQTVLREKWKWTFLPKSSHLLEWLKCKNMFRYSFKFYYCFCCFERYNRIGIMRLPTQSRGFQKTARTWNYTPLYLVDNLVFAVENYRVEYPVKPVDLLF